MWKLTLICPLMNTKVTWSHTPSFEYRYVTPHISTTPMKVEKFNKTLT